MSVETHRAAIVAKLGAVAEVGRVHDLEPWGRTQAEFEAQYLHTLPDGAKQLRGWFVRRTRTVETTAGLGRTINEHTWQLRCFMALDSAARSEIAFDTLVEAVRRAFRNDLTLGGAVQPGPVNRPAGLSLTDSTPAMFVGVLCHAATLSLATVEYLDDGE